MCVAFCIILSGGSYLASRHFQAKLAACKLCASAYAAAPRRGLPTLHHERGKVPSVLAGLHSRDTQPGVHSTRHTASMHAAHGSALG